LLIAAAITAAAGAYAQGQQPPAGGQSDPTDASSPHQRSATGTESPEASATTEGPEARDAATPHQKSAATEKVSGAMLKMARQDGAVPGTFVKKAALDGMTEVEMGKIALEKSQNPKVREFAQRMITDHTKANKELAAAAKAKGLDVPMKLDAEHQSMVQSLASKSGAAFDAAYREHMTADHSKAVAMFEGASSSSDSDLASLAKKTLPTLEEHKKLAEALPATQTR
jgi:putative membrane protein